MRRGEGPSTRLTFRLDPVVRTRLKWYAEIYKVAEGEIVRQALEPWFAAQEKQPDDGGWRRDSTWVRRD